MAWEEWFCFGGTEIINNARVRGYAETAGCMIPLFQDPGCEGAVDALNDGVAYVANTVPSMIYNGIEPPTPTMRSFAPEDAPWYENTTGAPEFLGVYCISATGLEGSTMSAPVTEGVLDGGVVGRQRMATREIRFRVLLLGLSDVGAEYGMTWLQNMLRASGCGSHGTGCSSSDLTFMHSCPPTRASFGGPYDLTMEFEFTRFAHEVTCVSGPLIEQKITRDNYTAYIAEFTLVAANPRIYRPAFWSYTDNSGYGLVEDNAINLVPFPSATLAGVDVEIARNLSPNPSVEVNDSGWSATVTTVSGTSAAAYFTSGRVTDYAGVGTCSYRGRILGNGTTNVANSVTDVRIFNTVSLSIGAGRLLNVAVWGAATIITGSQSQVISLTADLLWRNGTTVVRTDSLGTAPASAFTGHVFRREGITPPTAAYDNVQVRVTGRVRWASNTVPANNSDVRVFGDAVLLSAP